MAGVGRMGMGYGGGVCVGGGGEKWGGGGVDEVGT